MPKTQRKLTAKEQKRKILTEAFREEPAKAVRIHERMKELHFKSLDGYCGDNAVQVELAREWARQINKTLPATSSMSMWLGRQTSEQTPRGILLN